MSRLLRQQFLSHSHETRRALVLDFVLRDYRSLLWLDYACAGLWSCPRWPFILVSSRLQVSNSLRKAKRTHFLGAAVLDFDLIAPWAIVNASLSGPRIGAQYRGVTSW
jgi:hypothetical protein